MGLARSMNGLVSRSQASPAKAVRTSAASTKPAFQATRRKSRLMGCQDRRSPAGQGWRMRASLFGMSRSNLPGGRDDSARHVRVVDHGGQTHVPGDGTMHLLRGRRPASPARAALRTPSPASGKPSAGAFAPGRPRRRRTSAGTERPAGRCAGGTSSPSAQRIMASGAHGLTGPLKCSTLARAASMPVCARRAARLGDEVVVRPARQRLPALEVAVQECLITGTG